MKKLVIIAGLLMGLAFVGCEQPKETLSIIPVPLKTDIQGGPEIFIVSPFRHRGIYAILLY